MPSFDQLAKTRTSLSDAEVDQLQHLVGSWSLLCDLSFSDLLLYAPVDEGCAEFLTLGHCRSVTSPTVRQRDPVGSIVSAGQQPSLLEALSKGRMLMGPVAPEHVPRTTAVDDELVEETMLQPWLDGRLLAEHVPVGFGGRFIAVMVRESDSVRMRQTSPTERVYRDVWRRFAEMVISGEFPFATEEGEGEFREPRVGDGTILLDRERRIEFASPNAVSALNRLGVGEDPRGRTFAEIGIDETVVANSVAARRSITSDLVAGDDLDVVVRCLPILSEGRATGALLLTRDISELRSRDRLLLSREVTIREINHRVKNNLQTIQALLRLQARRASSADARDAIEESARRVGAIAIVHETLSADAADTVDFDQVVSRILSMVEEGAGATERPLRLDVNGRLGTLPGEVAMPLAVVLTELVQNAIDHRGGDGSADHDVAAGEYVVTVALNASAQELRLRVVDDGPGVPEGFSLDRDAGLGLTIVRTFVVQDLAGSISIRSRDGGSDTPDGDGRGCVVDVKVPRRAR